jgi:hypothetical protein
MKLPRKFVGEYWLLVVKILWPYELCIIARKSRHSGRNLDLNDQLWSGRQVGAAHNLNNEFLRQPRAEKLSVGLTSVSEMTACLGYENKCVLSGCAISVSPK